MNVYKSGQDTNKLQVQGAGMVTRSENEKRKGREQERKARDTPGMMRIGAFLRDKKRKGQTKTRGNASDN